MAYWLALCPAKCLKPCCFSQCPLPSLSHSPSLHFHLFSPLSLPLFLPRYESWLSSQPIPLAVIRGFGFQPACISRPGGSGKNSHLFQSNKEWLVRAIQICETSKRTSCTQLLWWITKTKSQPLCLAPKRWAAWWYGSLAWMSSFYASFSFLFTLSLFSHN